ncbi:MAG: glutamine amidotransferase family protein [bacterium]|nr:glutamine amidotransferase family protein [bacterium]MDD6225804.1 glutamine amidotransferase family protein [bacterium]
MPLLKEGEVRIPSGCAISGMISKDGHKENGDRIIESIKVMHDRSNGLGGGFAAYGIYPEFKDLYAFHTFYDSKRAKDEAEEYINSRFEIASMSVMPTRNIKEITDAPLIWRYFLKPLPYKVKEMHVDEDEYVFHCVMSINNKINGAFVFSSGKDMGAFKAVGYPEDVGRYYRLDEYEAYCWTAHGRYPTNTPGWWGGAHPFAVLDTSVVHNGEISSYDANRRYIEMFGYKCSLLTDTEAIAYIVDYLVRKQGLSYEDAAHVMAAPFWDTIENMSKKDKEKFKYLRNAFASLLITGPFSILVGFTGGMMALNDRLKLRSMVIGEKDNMYYVASEESAIRIIEPNLDRIWSPKGGEPVIFRVEGGKY